MTHLSLFSGIGGIDLAAEWAGFKTIAFCEIDPFCQKVLARHWPGVPIYDDIRTLTAESLFERGIRSVDLLSGGFPCQPFSLAGKRKGRDDERFLFPELLRVIREVRPVWALLENVPGLLSIAIDEVIESVGGAGYQVFPPLVYAAADVGAPHGRERVFIVAHAAGIGGATGVPGPDPGDEGHAGIVDDGGGKARVGVDQVNPTSEGLEGSVRAEREGRGYGLAIPDEAMGNAERGVRNGRTDEPGRGPEERTPVDWTGEELGDSAGRVRCGPASNVGFPVAADEDPGLSGGRAEPRLGGNTDGLPGRMDASRWPAPIGAEQYEWEPSRLCGRIPNRAARLKALGNAVVPQQVYPVLAGIAACMETQQ